MLAPIELKTDGTGTDDRHHSQGGLPAAGTCRTGVHPRGPTTL